MRTNQRARNSFRDRNDIFDRKLSFTVHPLAQRLAFDKRHHVKQKPIRAAGIEQGQDVRVLERCRHRNLVKKPLVTQHRCEFRLHDLKRDLALVLQIFGEVDGGHAARADLAFD